uniref:Nonstructural polyprotein n=1 Tax=Homalodisca coagulata virus 1 TaxID=2170238 RepID=A0A1C8QHU0_9VIRU|nr:nonstructural polyprotein [Homalodisca coagulata virus 1]ANS71497.1 nonstructural polyprotein [Homalodisca coagulata virus 1]ANS71501.1 nonstructural polyprotein [Homalodisca coagulata virus 1]ANS71503.1 nonstructural polyprotein [Homalodisca coagulata virus 1]ANS71505.1 nonstructural polyprotein [Homalodisca coagulata virus 1]
MPKTQQRETVETQTPQQRIRTPLRTEQTETTLATPVCSSLSGTDASPAITVLSTNMTSLLNEIYSNTYSVTLKDFRRALHRWTNKTQIQFRHSPPSKDRAALCLLQIHWWLQQHQDSYFSISLEQLADDCFKVLELQYRPFYDKVVYGSIDNALWTEISWQDLLLKVVSHKLEYLSLSQVLGNRILRRKFNIRSHMLRMLLSAIRMDLERELKLEGKVQQRIDQVKAENAEDWREYDRGGPVPSRDRDTYCQILLENELERLMQSTWTRDLLTNEWIQAEVQGLFDIKIVPDEAAFMEVFTSIKDYISEQFGASLQFAKDLLVNIVVLIILWNLVSLLWNKAYDVKYIGIVLTLLSGLVAVICAAGVAAVIGRILMQILDLFTTRQTLPAPFDNWREEDQENEAWARWHQRNSQQTFIHPSLLENTGNNHWIEAEAQAGEPKQSKVLALLSLATISLVTSKIKDSWSLDYFTKQIALLPRFTTGVTCLLDSAQAVFKIVHKEILVDIFGYEPLTEEGEHPMIDDFNTLMQQIIDADQRNEIQTSTIYQSLVLQAEQLGLRILQTSGLGEYRAVVSQQYAILRRLHDRLGLRGLNAKGQRMAPIIIQLYGETGQGKSTIVTTLALKLLSKICDAEGIDKAVINPDNLIYARNVEQEFWDGYHGQLVSVFDDFAQHQDFAQVPNPELFEIIRAGNTFPYPLHMADIADKNTTTFQSRIVILTTNQKKPKVESLVAPEAFYRRIDQSYEVSFKPEVLTRQSKTVETIEESARGNLTTYSYSLKPEHRQEYSPEIQQFQQFDINTERKIGNPISLDELIDNAFRQYNARFNFETTRKMHDDQLARQLGFIRAQPQIGWFAPLHYIRPAQPREDVDVERRNLAQEFHASFQNYKIKLQQIKENLKRKMEEHKVVLKALGVVAMAVGVYKIGSALAGLVSKRDTQPKVSASAQSPYAPRPVALRQSAYHPTTRATKTTINKILKATGQAADNSARDIITSVMNRGMYSLSVDSRVLGSATFLTGKILMFPRHFISFMAHQAEANPNSKVTLKSHNTQYEMLTKDVLLEVENIFDDDNLPLDSDGNPDQTWTHDCVAVVFKTADNHKDRTDQFLSREEQSKLDKVDVILANIHEKDNNITHTTSCVSASGVQRVTPGAGPPVYGEYEIGDTQYRTYTRDYWRYALNTTYGDCGGLIFLNNKMSHRKILGMHVMGLSQLDSGFALSVYREDVQAYVRLVRQDDPSLVTPCAEPIITTAVQCLPFAGDFHPLGKSPFPSTNPGKSKIEKSELHPDNCAVAWREPVSHPALLKPITVRPEDGIPFPSGTTFDPLHYRLEKCGQRAKCLDQQLLDIVRRSYTTELRQILQTHKYPEYKSVYTFDEAVLGLPGDPYVNSINRASAPGYGWIKDPGFPGKKTWFGRDEEFDLSRAGPVRERCAKIIDLARNNERYPHVFIDTLKDERKPIAKWWKTRVFSACSQDYYIACKQYYQGIVGLLTRHRIDTGVCVGINVYSHEWDLIVRHLHQCNDRVVAGDFENFDASLLTQVLDAARIVLNDLAGDLPDHQREHDDIRSVLFLDLVHSTHLARDVLYSWTHSLPSGHFLTAIVNSLYVNLIFRYLLAKSSKLTSHIQIDQLCRRMKLVSYGDDHIVSIPSGYEKIFNQSTLPTLFSEIGMTYTDETKSDREVPETRRIEDVTFLKRGFRWEKELNRYVAPLSLDTVLETPFWRSKSLNPRSITESSVEWACHELALHDESTFQEWTKKIGLVCKDAINFVPNLSAQRVEYIRYLETSWDSLDESRDDED